MTGDDDPGLWYGGDWPSDDLATRPSSSIDFLAYTPMSQGLRVAEVAAAHASFGNRLRAAIDTTAPTWFDWAAWAAVSIHGVLRRPAAVGEGRMRRALSVANLEILLDAIGIASAALGEPPPTAVSSGRRWALPRQPAPADADVDDRARFLSNAGQAASGLYALARAENEPGRRDELVLLANLCHVAHEQVLADGPLEAAMRAQVLLLYKLQGLNPFDSFLLRSRRERSLEPGPALHRIERWNRRAVTELLPFRTPWGNLWIGRPFPDDLVVNDIRPEMPDGFGPHPFDLFPPNRAGAHDWADLDDRLRTIFALFRDGAGHSAWRDAERRSVPELSGAKKARARLRRRFLTDRPTTTPVERPRWHAATARTDLPDDEGQFTDISLFAGPDAVADLAGARQLYGSNRSWILSALLIRSIPASYAEAPGAMALAPRVLGVHLFAEEQAARTMQGDAARRAASTVRFLDGLFLQPDDKPMDAGVLSSVRVAHAAHRAKLQNSLRAAGSLEAFVDANGEPINEVDVVGTALSFVVPVRHLFQEFLPQRSATLPWDAWARTWARIAVALGVRAEIVRNGDAFLDASDMEALGRHYDAVNARRSTAGVFLLTNLVEDLGDAFPKYLAYTVPPVMRAFGDDRHLDMLLHPHSAVAKAMRATASVSASIGLESVLLRLGDALMQQPIDMLLDTLSVEAPVTRT